MGRSGSETDFWLNASQSVSPKAPFLPLVLILKAMQWRLMGIFFYKNGQTAQKWVWELVLCDNVARL